MLFSPRDHNDIFEVNYNYFREILLNLIDETLLEFRKLDDSPLSTSYVLNEIILNFIKNFNNPSTKNINIDKIIKFLISNTTIITEKDFELVVNTALDFNIENHPLLFNQSKSNNSILSLQEASSSEEYFLKLYSVKNFLKNQQRTIYQDEYSNCTNFILIDDASYSGSLIIDNLQALRYNNRIRGQLINVYIFLSSITNYAEEKILKFLDENPLIKIQIYALYKNPTLYEIANEDSLLNNFFLSYYLKKSLADIPREKNEKRCEYIIESYRRVSLTLTVHKTPDALSCFTPLGLLIKRDKFWLSKYPKVEGFNDTYLI